MHGSLETDALFALVFVLPCGFVQPHVLMGVPRGRCGSVCVPSVVGMVARGGRGGEGGGGAGAGRSREGLALSRQGFLATFSRLPKPSSIIDY